VVTLVRSGTNNHFFPGRSVGAAVRTAENQMGAHPLFGCAPSFADSPARFPGKFVPNGHARLNKLKGAGRIRGPEKKLRLDFKAISRHPIGMNLILSTQNVTLTKAIEDHLMVRINKLEHLDRFAINTRVTLEHDRTKAPERQFSCSMRVSLPGPDLFAEDAENDLYAAIDLVSKKIEQQIRKRHSKFKARNHKVVARSKRSRQEAGL
jgi:putative sigma-54 modulation protein